jgi:tripartite-type tricarboxylate transporter receptor subunit TctC
MKRPLALLSLSLSLALSLLLSPAAQAQEVYPNKPIKIVVPFPPGGAADNFARLIGQKLGDAWGQSVVIENKPGAGGQIAITLLKDSPADGSTMVLTPSSML